jgi:hypothetical protein
MDSKSGDFSTQKNILEKEIATYLLEAAEKKLISLQDIQPIAKEMVSDFDIIQNNNQLFLFLEKIKNKWSFFSNLYAKYHGEAEHLKEKKVIEKLSSYINSTN